MARVIVEGLSESLDAIKAMKAGLDAAAKRITIRSAAAIEAQAKRNFIGSHRKGEPHVGGSEPNVVTGYLRRSITHTTATRYLVAAWMSDVGPTAIYGRRIELGYTGGGGGRGRQTTKPYPYMAPALRQTSAQLAAIAYEEWSRVTG